MNNTSDQFRNESEVESQRLNQRINQRLYSEVESISVNLRPLTVETLGDIGGEAPLSSINLLIMKSNVVLQPLGDFKKPYLYSHRRWRRIQPIADAFWCWWRKEFLATPQRRAKWQKIRRNFKIADIVILKKTPYEIGGRWQKLLTSLKVMMVKYDSQTTCLR